MVDQTDKDTKLGIYTKENKKGKVNQLDDVGEQEKSTQ